MGKTVDLRTELPGPKSQEILARKERVIAEAKSIYLPIAIDRGAGATVTDVDGNTFLDWTGGIGCLNVGHANPAVSAALHAQVDRFLHTDFTMVPYESYVELAERLLAVTPIAGETRAAFFNSGAEAVENAVKIAKHATGRAAVITFDRAFHGRTLMAMTLTSRQRPYKLGMGPFARRGLPGALSVSVPGRGRAIRPPRLWTRCAGCSRPMSTPQSVAAIIFEPVQGEGGFIVPPAAVGARAPRDRRPARHRADRRRGAVRIRPHRPDVRGRALRRRARPDHRCQVDRRRASRSRA